MEQNNLKIKAGKILKGIGKVIARWFFLLSLIAATLFCVFVWYRYIWKAEWDDAKKQVYISEQAKFSFDKNSYQKMSDGLAARKDKFQNFPKYSGRDIFFPEGF